MCIFCDIVKGEIPSSKIYEDDEHIVILDISQTTKGHSLVIPKKHYNNILEMPEQDAAKLMSVASKIAKTLTNKLGCKGINILNNTNEVAGQTVMHTHVHVIPRYSNDDTITISFKENKFNLEDIQKQIIED